MLLLLIQPCFNKIPVSLGVGNKGLLTNGMFIGSKTDLSAEDEMQRSVALSGLH